MRSRSLQQSATRSSFHLAESSGPIDAVVVALGVAAAFYYKRRRPAKYEQAGRLINEGL